MTEVIQDNEAPEKSKGLRGIHIMWIVLATILVTMAVTIWVVRTYIYAKDFTPVELSEKENQTLNIKLKSLGYDPGPGASGNSGQTAQETDEQWLRAERYSEEGGKREVSFSERELNAMLANNRDLAKKLAIDQACL